MKKVPWGIIAGLLAILISLCTLGFIAAYFIMGAIAGATNSGVSPFATWWQTALFVADVVCVLAFAASVVFYVKKERALKKKEGEA